MSDSDAMKVAVVGAALRLPGASTLDELWHNLSRGVESVRFFSDEELAAAGVAPEALADPAYVRAAATIEGEDLFDAEFFDFNPREAELTDPQQRVFLECAWAALEQAACDPERFDGAIGVFGGCGLNAYFLNNVQSHAVLIRSIPALQWMIGAEKDYLAPRVSYKLDLDGPSVSVQSACSTSLVAVHLACQSLQDYQCDLALAGGVSIRNPQVSGYRYQEGGVLSSDGHCRPFDAKASGTVPGSGAGVVALKRLEDALADGDAVLGVICGSALNNDGAGKVGFTAPGAEGQVAVISEALVAAGLTSRDVSYVETHGTGTVLGDPIEVAALQRAFEGDGRRRACALGSIKSNLGHLDAAAGVAGLLKTLLALRHRRIPPSLHFETSNPAIRFDDGPFYVNPRLADWPAPDGDGVRRAGVSSFGIGGTNVHLIVEEAPRPSAAEPSRDWQLLQLSARTPTALDAATDRLARHLEEHPEQDLADVAHSLRMGRKLFEHRRILICRDASEAAEALRERDPERVLSRALAARDLPAVFLFPGQGAQYPGMGAGLVAAEPEMRAALDLCAEILAPRLGCDLREVIRNASADPSGAELTRTRYAQPALFAVEYALARMWKGWGVEPAAMIGHSVGEYVAACLASVLSLEDALALVAARGELMDGLPEGAMLSVPLPEAEVLALLEDDLSLAAVNGPRFCVVSGPLDAVDELRRRLAGSGVEARRLHTSHAFHSAMMDPILDDFAAEVAEVRLHEPETPYLSGMTGTRVAPGEVTRPDYWVRHLRQPVRFGDGLAELLKEPGRVYLEVGPGRTLGTFLRQHPEAARAGALAFPSLRHPTVDEDDAAFATRTLGQLWTAGARIDWEAYASAESRRRVPLPTYPFEGKRYWLEAVPRHDAPLSTIATSDVEPETPSHETPGHERPAVATAYVEPRDETEAALAEIWQRTLSLERVGAVDDFFELGGHSLLATEIAAGVREAFRVDVPLNDLLAKPTVAGMAAAVARTRGAAPVDAGAVASRLPEIVPAPEDRHRPFPLTDVQQAYWIGRGDAFELGGVATHIYREYDAEHLDLERLAAALRWMIERHDVLRAVVDDDGRQRVLAELPPYEIAVDDLRGRTDEEAESALLERRRTMSHQVLPADRWPLFEVRASRLGEESYRLHISFDMLLGDAWSWEILSSELWDHYHRPERDVAPLELTFRDYVLAARRLKESDAYRRDLDYWRGRLADFPAAPELPVRRAAEGENAAPPVFERLATRLEAEHWSRLKGRAAAAQLTASGILLAAFSEVLRTWSKSPRFALNLTLFNRLPCHPEVDSLIGDFTSLVLLAVDGSRDEPFEARARRLQRRLWDDLDHRLVSGVRVLRELAGSRRSSGPAGAMMPVVFTSTLGLTAERGEGAGDDDSGDGDSDLELRGVYGISQTPQVWLDHQVHEHEGALYFNWDVVEELFPQGLLREMFDAYEGLLRRLAGDETAWGESAPLRLAPRQLEARTAANATAAPLADDLLHTLFAGQARQRPDQPAVIGAERTLTYGELELRVRDLGLRLRGLGARPGRLVAVVMEKGWEQVVAVLGVLEAGAAYLPIDPGLPASRRDFLLENGEVEIVLTQARLDERLGWPERPLERLSVDLLEPWSPDLPALKPVQAADDLAYVIYTSGSTGRPKGVMIDHRGAVNTILDVNERFAVGPGDRVLALSSLSFDLSVWDVFGTLAAGATIVMPEDSPSPEPAAWNGLVAERGVTVWSSVPALMELLVDAAEARDENLPASLRLVMMSGDWIPVSLPGRVRALAENGEIELVSLGGATEASIWSILHPIGEVAPGQPSIPYGKPMRNQTFHVLDRHLRPRPEWVPGELFIGGAGLARGYWRDEEQTAARFLRHPRSDERLYRTGDLGRYLPGGEIQFLGREDFQVKIRGYRIELGEIEAALGGHPGVRETVVLACRDPETGESPGSARGSTRNARLVAFFLAAGEETPGDGELRDFLSARLPDYMVPRAFRPREAWPLTANGKIDRTALGREALLSPGERPAERRYVPPETDTEEVLVEICGAILGEEKLGVEDDFFELGGDSLMATRAIFQVRKAFEVDLPVRAFFDAPTVAGLAELVEEHLLAEIEALTDEEAGEFL